MKNVPAQVQKQADRADALIKEQNKATELSPEEKAAEEAKVKAEVKPTAKEPEHQEVKVDPVKTEVTEEKWQHKYQVLQGKYNAEIKLQQDDVKLLSSLKSQVTGLTQRVEEGDAVVQGLREQLKQKETPAPVPAKVKMDESVLLLLAAEDREHFEEEGIDGKSIEIIGKLIKDLTSGTQTPQQQPSVDVGKIKQEVKEEIKADRVRETGWKEFAEAVPDWKAVDQSVEFNDWLAERTSLYTPTTRKEALQTAQDISDYSTVIQMFNDFKKTQTVKAPEPKPVEEPLLNPEKLLEPTSTVSGHAITTDKPAGRTYTRAEVSQYATDFTRGKISGKEYAKLSQDIDKAYTEGRITN